MANTPNTKGKTMETPKTVTLTVRRVRPADFATAQRTVNEYRATGQGSNRTKWERVTAILGAVLTAIATGDSVEVTDLLTGTDGKDGQRTTDSPAYHQVHRALSHGAIRPEWENVRVIALKEVTTKGKTVTGVSTTTAKVGKCRVFISPA